LTLTVAGIDDEEALSIFFDGVHQHHNTFTIASSVVTFDTAIPTGTANVEIHYGKQPVASALAANVIDSEHYVDGSIDTAHIAANQIDGTLTKDALIADYSDVTITAADLIMYGDATDSNNTKRDTVQGIIDLAGGEWVRVSQTAVSSDVAQVDFTGLTTDNTVYAFYLEAIGADVYAGASDLQVQFGDSTPTYQTSGYKSASYQHYSSGTDGQMQDTTGVHCTDGTDADGEGASGWLFAMHMANASLKPRIAGTLQWENQSVIRTSHVGGAYDTALNAQSIRFNWTDSGNFGGNADGFITLYKMNLDG
jgi:hypothetical protein